MNKLNIDFQPHGSSFTLFVNPLRGLMFDLPICESKILSKGEILKSNLKM